MDLARNANTRWMSILVDELARCGLEAVCIAPGSRSTPLTLAFARHERIRVYQHLDERSAGFFALGLAKGSGRPVVLVCTSGTAAANFHPAVIEAYYAHVPLLVLTADRPPELRESGSNQTIDQIKLFGDHVRWFVELPTPADNTPTIVERHLRTLAARAYATAEGLVKGPVHLNCPFRKPLEPDAPTSAEDGPAGHVLPTTPPHTIIQRGHLWPVEDQVTYLTNLLRTQPRGVIVCGPECAGEELPAAVVELARCAGYPVLADTLSRVRHGPQTAGGYVLGGYNLWLEALGAGQATPDVIFRFGAVPTSAALSAFIARATAAVHVHVREDGVWSDDLHLTRYYLQADPVAVCRLASEQLRAAAHQPDPNWAALFSDLENRAWLGLKATLAQTPLFDGGAIGEILSIVPDDTIVFAGNSLPVRHVDAFDRPDERRLTMVGNRGASGIDGNVSTALGLTAATGRRVVAFLGDITFYHDMNGLLAARRHELHRVTFVVTNNNGGGIFHRLPVATHEPPFSELFLTPHGLTFAPAAALYGLHYAAVTHRDELEPAVLASLAADRPSLIEIMTDSRADHHLLRRLRNTVSAALQPIGTVDSHRLHQQPSSHEEN